MLTPYLIMMNVLVKKLSSTQLNATTNQLMKTQTMKVEKILKKQNLVLKMHLTIVLKKTAVMHQPQILILNNLQILMLNNNIILINHCNSNNMQININSKHNNNKVCIHLE